MMISLFRSKKGFTLIELMVVISVIAILVAIALPRFANSRRAANTAKIAADLRTIESAINIYYLNHNKYPGQATQLSNSDLAKDSVKYFASIPKPPSGQFYFARNIGDVGKVAGGAAAEYSIFINKDFENTGIVRPGLVVPEASDEKEQFFTLEHFVGFSSISNDPPPPFGK